MQEPNEFFDSAWPAVKKEPKSQKNNFLRAAAEQEGRRAQSGREELKKAAAEKKVELRKKRGKKKITVKSCGALGEGRGLGVRRRRRRLDPSLGPLTGTRGRGARRTSAWPQGGPQRACSRLGSSKTAS